MDEVQAEVGVGPWVGPWPDDPRYDPELLAGGDRRNVVDRYRYWRREAVVADLDTRRHAYTVAIENWQYDLNVGTVVRTANAFLAAEVHIVGNRRWNRRGAMVTDRYQHIRHHLTVADPGRERDYVPALERIGFRLTIREPWWHGHRMLRADEPPCNLHVFGFDSPSW